MRLCKALIGNFLNPEKGVGNTEVSVEQWENLCPGKLLLQSPLSQTFNEKMLAPWNVT